MKRNTTYFVGSKEAADGTADCVEVWGYDQEQAHHIRKGFLSRDVAFSLYEGDRIEEVPSLELAPLMSWIA